jgi:uncharacterized iron-regulated membrane protein
MDDDWHHPRSSARGRSTDVPVQHAGALFGLATDLVVGSFCVCSVAISLWNERRLTRAQARKRSEPAPPT